MRYALWELQEMLEAQKKIRRHFLHEAKKALTTVEDIELMIEDARRHGRGEWTDEEARLPMPDHLISF